MSDTVPEAPKVPEKKEKKGWVWILLLVILISGFMVWLLRSRRANEPVTAAVVTDPLTSTVVTDPLTTTVVTDPLTATVVSATVDPGATAGTGGEATIAAILAQPAQWLGREFSGTVNVTSVPTDRGFWIEQAGQRLFVILDDRPAETPVDINPGQQVRIRGTVRDAQFLPQVAGEALSDATRNTAREQPAYLIARDDQIEILQRGQGQ